MLNLNVEAVRDKTRREVKAANKLAHRLRILQRKQTLRRRSDEGKDGLVDQRNLRGTKLSVGGVRADNMEMAEAWAALDITFHYNNLVVELDHVEQNTSALRNFGRISDPDKAKASKDREGRKVKDIPTVVEFPPTPITNVKEILEDSPLMGATIRTVAAPGVVVA